MEQVTCIVCWELLFSEDFIVASTCCHIFHEKCLENWIEKSTTCPECRAECLRGSSRRLFFNSDPRDSEFTQKEVKYQEKIITLLNEIASQKEQFQEQLNAEMQIRENMHARIKMFEEQIGKLAGLTQSSPHLLPNLSERSLPNCAILSNSPMQTSQESLPSLQMAFDPEQPSSSRENLPPPTSSQNNLSSRATSGNPSQQTAKSQVIRSASLQTVTITSQSSHLNIPAVLGSAPGKCFTYRVAPTQGQTLEHIEID